MICKDIDDFKWTNEKKSKYMKPELFTSLLKRVDEILFYLWDPIGVKEEPAARSEYAGYVGVIFSLLISSKDQNTIAKQLMVFEENNMGLATNELQALKIGKILIEAKNAIEEGLS